ncbi:MAG: LCP family protein [Lachnospiraceae bacterium]|nr:LCP family protein [Lachnospiraceae bacterium]
MEKKQDKKKIYIAIGLVVLLIIGIVGGTYIAKVKENSKVNILCMGIDKYVTMTERHPHTNSIGQADVVFLISMDTYKKTMDIIAVPRDTMVNVEKYNSAMESLGEEELQLCLQYAYADGTINSCELTQKRVNEIFEGIEIDAYAAINFSAIKKINDAVGGVEVTMQEDYTVLNPLFVKGETLLLKGQNALEFIQKRDTSVAHTAYTRIDRQKQYLTEFMKQAKKTIKEKPELVSELYTILKDDMVTNLGLEDVLSIVTTVIDCPFEKIEFHKVEGEIINDGRYECFYPDENHIKELKEILK